MNSTLEYLIKKTKVITRYSTIRILMVLLLGMFIGNILFSDEQTSAHGEHENHTQASNWTCSMHPQVKLDEPGQCPICFMDLIPLDHAMGSDRSDQHTISAASAKLARIVTTEVREGSAHSAVQLSGKITYDETRVKTISAWFPGRLERLFVDYTGVHVNAGDHLYEIYSPELYSAQEELLLAHRRSPGSSTFNAVKEKTKLLGLSESQVEMILRTNKAQSTIQINSPIAGIVTHKSAIEGKYVRTGEQIYVIADLNKVWLVLEAYEKDLPWLSYGQEIEFTVAGLPGETFSAQISYIDPLVNTKTRSVTVRAVLNNPQGRLKPGMLTEATISVILNAHGQVVSPDLTGKWICPMHPEVIEDRSITCSLCGMDLVPYQNPAIGETVASDALLIPSSAVLKTGKRTLVYVELNRDDKHTYELREIVVGPRVGEDYLVLSGLSLGEKVVTQGNFKIDSAMQIAGKQSMMSASESELLQDISTGFKASLSKIYQEYLSLQSSLSADDVEASREGFLKLTEQIAQVPETPESWKSLSTGFQAKMAHDLKTQSIGELRTSFEYASSLILTLQKTYGHTEEQMLYEVYCPMAFDNKGAAWLQTDRQVRNPYFGASMLSCGEIKQSYSPQGVHDD